MKKTMPLVLSLTIISSVLLGCQSGENTTKDADKNKIEQETNQQYEEDNEKLQLVGEISKVNISESGKTGIIVLEDDASIETIEQMISGAVKVNGEVDMPSPEFKMDVFYTNDEHEQSFYLWIGEKGEKSALMRTEETHFIYTISAIWTDKLIDLIE